jgi:serine/threonine protein kinase
VYMCSCGRYRLVERLGSGGMSIVWRGYDEILRRQVAVKVLSPEYATNAGLRAGLYREAKAAAALSQAPLRWAFARSRDT